VPATSIAVITVPVHSDCPGCATGWGPSGLEWSATEDVDGNDLGKKWGCAGFRVLGEQFLGDEVEHSGTTLP